MATTPDLLWSADKLNFARFWNFFRWQTVNVAEVNQRRCWDESGQWLENVDQTNLALASGKLVLQKNLAWQINLDLCEFHFVVNINVKIKSFHEALIYFFRSERLERSEGGPDVAALHQEGPDDQVAAGSNQRLWTG